MRGEQRLAYALFNFFRCGPLRGTHAPRTAGLFRRQGYFVLAERLLFALGLSRAGWCIEVAHAAIWRHALEYSRLPQDGLGPSASQECGQEPEQTTRFGKHKFFLFGAESTRRSRRGSGMPCRAPSACAVRVIVSHNSKRVMDRFVEEFPSRAW